MRGRRLVTLVRNTCGTRRPACARARTLYVRAMATTTIRESRLSAPDAPSIERAGRVASIDIIRGAVMVLMAIDHVRVYSGLPAGGPTPGIFFTRWVTHFSAPGFVFLAGTSAFFYGRKYQGLPRYLLVRGAWLILLELTVIRVGWTFNLDFANYLLAGVIWMIGWCMILIAALVRLPSRVVGAIGLAIIALHNAI